MQLIGYRHKGLKQIHAGVVSKGVPAAMADKLRKLLFALETADGLEQLSRFPGWKLHRLKGSLGWLLEFDRHGKLAVDLSLRRGREFSQRNQLN